MFEPLLSVVPPVFADYWLVQFSTSKSDQNFDRLHLRRNFQHIYVMAFTSLRRLSFGLELVSHNNSQPQVNARHDMFSPVWTLLFSSVLFKTFPHGYHQIVLRSDFVTGKVETSMRSINAIVGSILTILPFCYLSGASVCPIWKFLIVDWYGE